jgi:hypothetical protein
LDFSCYCDVHEYITLARLLVVRCVQVLDMPENAAIKRELSQLVGQLAQTSGRRGGGILGAVAGMMGASGGNGSGGDGGVSHADPADVLARCRALAMNVAVPQSLVQDLAAAMRAAGECASASALLPRVIPDSQRHVGDRLARGKSCFIELLCSYVSCAHPYKVWRVRGEV